MSKKLIPHIRKTFTLQQDQQDCGVACLLSVLKYHRGSASLERLRELSGTHTQGTTMLGLVQAATSLGFSTKGLQADMAFLKELSEPCILHVRMEQGYTHFILCYFYDASKQAFCIGDPAKGILYLSESALNELWVSKALISLTPNEAFSPQQVEQKAKIKYFLGILAQDYPVLAVSAAIGVFISLLGLAMAIFSQKLIDDILPEKDTKRLITGVALLLVLLFIRAFLGYLRGFFLNKQSQNFNNRLVGSFLEKLFFLPLPFLKNRKTGDLIARLNDTRRIQQNISLLSGNLVIDILVVLLSSFFIFSYHWLIACITLLSIPMYAGLAFVFNGKILQGQRKVMESYSKNESNYIDVIQGIDTIKSFQKEPFFLNNTKWVYAAFQEALLRLGIIGLRFTLMAEIIGVLLLGSIIATACFLILKDALKVGELMAILTVAGNIIPAVIRLSTANISLQEAKIAFDRMYEFASLPQENMVAATSPKPKNTMRIERLRVENLSFRFVGRKALFQNLSFDAEIGEITGIIGQNGIGKSTLFGILQGFYTAEQGQVFFNEIPAQAFALEDLRQRIAILPQEIKIFNATLLENICLDNPQIHYEQVLQFCQALGFDGFFRRLPQGYFTLLGEQGVHLSGGQKQILALARALYKKPEVLLLDEFSTAMDIEVAEFSLRLLERLKSEMLILHIAHQESPKLPNTKTVLLSAQEPAKEV